LSIICKEPSISRTLRVSVYGRAYASAGYASAVNKGACMSKFTDYIDGFADKSSTLAKEELKELILSAKKDESEFVRLQAVNVEHWTGMLAAGQLTPAGFKRLVTKMDVLTELENIKLDAAAKASAQRLADGIQKHIIDGLCKLL
jgi:hypothetical protein